MPMQECFTINVSRHFKHFYVYTCKTLYQYKKKRAGKQADGPQFVKTGKRENIETLVKT